jgi:hypothetical protein
MLILSAVKRVQRKRGVLRVRFLGATTIPHNHRQKLKNGLLKPFLRSVVDLIGHKWNYELIKKVSKYVPELR